jgi:uncharacterized protein YjbI with pentapeptide repeats
MVGIVGGLAVLLSGVITPLAGEQTRRRGGFVSADLSDVVVVPRWLPRPLNIVRIDLRGQWLARVNLRHASAHLANLEGANLEGATLQGADLRSAKLLGAHLWMANLQGASLPVAHLQRAQLRYAQFQGADLLGASHLGADLRGVDLRGVDLREVRNLTPAQLQAA